MYGALDANRLCLLSLGNKHAFGLDGITADDEQSYGKSWFLPLSPVNLRLTECLAIFRDFWASRGLTPEMQKPKLNLDLSQKIE